MGYRWRVNTGDKMIVYDYDVYCETGGGDLVEIGNIAKGECYCRVLLKDAGDGWPYDAKPVIFINADHDVIYGVVEEVSSYEFFTDVASNGSSWVSVDTLERRVYSQTRARYADGTGNIVLEAGSRVWLTPSASNGDTNLGYCAVTKVQKKDGKIYEFAGHGYIDLVYGGKWLKASNILLRK